MMPPSRNDPCPCGSGKKYKKCCLGKAAAQSTSSQSTQPVSQNFNATNVAPPSERLLQAVALHQAGKLDEAKASYQSLLKENPADSDALHYLGLVSFQQGDYANAAHLIEQAIKLNGHIPAFHFNLGNAYKQLKQFDSAIDAYREAIRLDPRFLKAYFNLGNTFKEQVNLDAAVESYHVALSLKPNYAEAHNNLGLALQAQGELDAAVESYHKALAVRPDYAEAHNNLGNTFKDQGKLDTAAESYHKALSIKPDCAEALISLGMLLEKQGLREEAQKRFEQCLELDREDKHGARFMLASLGVEKMPERAPHALLAKLYKERAKTWGQNRYSDKRYLGAELVAGKLRQSITDLDNLDILDAGCGTGLVGELVHDLARQIDGVDMSEFMLQKAKSKGVYKRLFQGDLVSFMAEQPENYDVVTCAATLIHFGDLHKVFEAAAVTLRDNGLFIFTLFQNEETGEDIVIGSIEDGFALGGCYAHSKSYVTRSATSANFIVEQLETDVHEYCKEKSVMGLIVVLRRQFRNGSTI